MLECEYIKFAFRLNKHLPGLVDSYFGPEHLSKQVEQEPVIPLIELREQLQTLLRGTKEVQEEIRRIYFIKQLDALEVLLEDKLGTKLLFEDLVARLFDLSVLPVPDSILKELRSEIIWLLPTRLKSSYLDAVQDWEKERQIDGQQVFIFLNNLLEEYRQRTRRFINLPRDEQVVLKAVSAKPWPAYNRYGRGASSSIEINTDRKRTKYELATMLAHETYPGHHTELSIKENLTYKRNKCLEVSIQLLNTPMCVISEGIADCGFKFLEEIEPLGFADEQDKLLAEKLATLRMAAWVNAVFQLHLQNEPPEVVAKYLHENSLMPIQRARDSLNFHLQPLTRVYALTYWWGRKLVWDSYLDAKNLNRSRDFFAVLYSLPLCPTTLATLSREMIVDAG